MSADVRHSSESNEHYTPLEIVEAARLVLGGIDLDPFSCEKANETIGAEMYYTIDDDGFSLRWGGRCLVNVHGGKTNGKSNLKRGWFKLGEELRAGRVDAAIFVCFDLGLLQTSQIKTPPGLPLPHDFPICYPSSRLEYRSPSLPGPTEKHPDRKPSPKQIADFEATGLCIGESPPHPSCIIGVRVDPVLFWHTFTPIGKVVIPVSVANDPRFDAPPALLPKVEPTKQITLFGAT